jgi:predicted nucleic acid-binding protein
MDDETAERYAIIQDFLRRHGSPIPTNDLWIAASAMQHGLALITADRHFLILPQVVTVHVGRSIRKP